jgi:tripartite motif-containing protein 71
VEPQQNVRKARLGALFVATALLLVLVVTASSAGASDNPSVNLEVPGQEVSGDDPERLFDGDHVVPVDLEAVEAEEAEREDWLESPAAEHEREVSQAAYTDLSPSASEELLREAFLEQLETLNADPARFLSDAQLIRPLEETAAAVKKDGEYSLMDAGIPVRTDDESGDPAKVELSLEPTPEGFEPINGLVDLRLPDAADGAAEVGEEGVAISQAGADPSPARRFGDKSLFYGDVLPDTDLLVAPTAKGVELFNLLRSEESPEDLRFAIDVPAGAELRADEGGGAEVARDGEALTRIASPVAVDAQGTEVPVELKVEGDVVVLHVAQQAGEYAFPILVDPIIEDWANTQNSWYAGNKWDALSNGAWKYASNNSQIKSWTCCWEGSHAGLMISSEKNVFYGAKQFGQWSYSTANSKTYIQEAWLTPFWRNDESCGSSSEPHDYIGMLWEPGEYWNPVLSDKAKLGGYTIKGNGHAFIMGMGTGNGVWIGCNRYVYLGGIALWIDDDWPPVINSVTGVPSGEWTNGPASINLSVNTSDEGLGVRLVTLTHDGKSLIGQDNVGCTGLYGNRCPNSRGSVFKMTGLSLGEGIRSSSVSVEDPTGKTATGGGFQTKVDYSPPDVTLESQLAEATGDDKGAESGDAKTEKLRLPVYNLKIVATDGSNATNLTRRSGVKNIEIYLDGVKQSVPWSAQAATEDSRPMTQSYQLKLSTLTTSGLHKLEVKVGDQANNPPRVRSLEFEYFPATGMKDEYVMHHFKLSDEEGGEAEADHPEPELAVNVMNGNLVYREQDVEVEGPMLDLELERYYNSMLPESENTEWGDGWNLAQTPELDPVKVGGSPVPNQADILDSSGMLEGGVGLPTEVGGTDFDPELRVSLTKKTGGGYELSDETGEPATSVAFDETGQAEALLTEGHAKVDYSYEGGDLAEIEVEDPATFDADPSELEIPKPQLVSQPTFASSFGANGSGDGQLKAPADVAVDAQGNLWVVDKSNNRIEKFDAAGKYLAKFGSAGAGNGQFNRPTAIAIASNGDLLVTDSGNARVERFSSAGAYLSQFGSAGAGNGQFSSGGPEGIAIDSSGNIWVSDTYGGRLQKFTSAGVFSKVAGSKGSGSGQLGEPTGLDVDSSGNVWVADWQNNRVSRFNSNGEFISQFGSVGSGDGQFSHPDEIEIDKLGNVWVGDQSNNRIQQFDLSAQFKAKFGSGGTGQGQFSFAYPMGIASDAKGHMWITDVNNNRIQEWLVPVEKPAYVSTFGSSGSGDGQLKAPGDIALAGNSLWVVDKTNNRVQRFDKSGKYLAKFGSLGTGNGQFNRPASIAVDRDGNLLVVDSNNNRVEKFDPSGQFISKFGSGGTGNGQFAAPEGVTTDFQGNIWVSDTDNGRLQKFDENGNFLKVISSKGSGSGQLGEPTGLDVDPEGNVWVADWLNNRITAFKPDGSFLGSFGTAGSGPGQFNHPDEVEIDSHGNVWVGDQSNNRVQRFNLKGEYVGQFGSIGFGEGTFFFALTMGITSDSDGHLWVTDVANNRIQRWMLGNYAPIATAPLDLSDGDPKVTVETPAGLVSKVSGNAAGTHTYTHVGDDLTAHKGPAGETKYEYDSSGRMTKVTLPNGTWGSITYQTDSRVKSVTVKLDGWASSKTTTFEYQDGPPQRRTVVDPPDAPVVTYDIGGDGSVLKWWNSSQPPTIDFISGTLWDHREKDDDLWAGDHLLDVQAFSAEGIASIWVVTNGNELVHETNCEQTEAPGTECVNPPLKSEWVMNTEQYPPGHLPIEVIVTDHAEGTTAKRFWVDIPEPPPPPAPGTPVPPKFVEIFKFRSEYGLEKVFPVATEIERNERIFNLINAWYQGDSVARASRERWGVPLRPEDVAELEYREWLYDTNGEKIDKWVEATSPGSYAGYYMDHAAGGIMRIGFTSNQSAQLAGLESSLSLVGGASRLQVYPTPPISSYLAVRATGQSVLGAMESNSTLANLVTSVEDDEAGKATRVGTANVAQVEGILDQVLGVNAPVSVEYEAGGGTLLAGRYRNEGRMRAGDYINSDPYIFEGLPTGGPCTAGFGAEDIVDKPGTADDVYRLFVLMAGHCAVKIDEEVWRNKYDGDFAFPYEDAGKSEVGRVKRSAFQYLETGGVRTDATAIRVKEGDVVPESIAGWEGNGLPTEPATKARKGNTVCYSGAISKQVACGEIVARSFDWHPEDALMGLAGYWVRFPASKRPQHGDSGGPVWNLRTGASIGLISAGRPNDSLEETLVAPLLHPPNMPPNRVPGILHHVGMQPLSLKLGG